MSVIDRFSVTQPNNLSSELDIDTAVGVAAGVGYQPHEISGALALFSSAAEGVAISGVADRDPGNIARGNSGANIVAGVSNLEILRTGSSLNDVPVSARPEVTRYIDAGFEVLVRTDASAGSYILARRPDGSETTLLVQSNPAPGSNVPAVAPSTTAAFRKGAIPSPLRYLQDPDVGGQDRFGTVGVDGALSFTEDPDVSIGQGEFPYSLEFRRIYSSNGAGDPALGPGWSHNWSSSAMLNRTDPSILLDDENAQATVPTVVALLYLVEAARENTLKSSAVAAQIANWWSARTRETAFVTLGGQTSTFVRHLDGVYRDTATGVETLTIAGDMSQFTRTLADGSTQRFLPGNNPPVAPPPSGGVRPYLINQWTFPTGMQLNYDYSGGLTVTNSLGIGIRIAYGAYPDPENCQIYHTTIYCAGSPNKGRIESVSSITPAGATVRQVTFDYQFGYCDDGSNLCARTLTGVNAPDRARRSYEYLNTMAVPLDESGPIQAFSLLTAIREAEGGSTRVEARWDWATSDVKWKPQVTAAYDAREQKTAYFTASGAERMGARDAAEGLSRVHLDMNGRTIAAADPMGRISRTAYDGQGRRAWVQSPWGDTTTYGYDVRSNLIERTRSPMAGCTGDSWWCQTLTVTAAYHATWNKPVSVTLPATAEDPTPRTWIMTYNAKGLVEEVQAPAVADPTAYGSPVTSPVWKTLYDNWGRVRTIEDPVHIQTTYEYNDVGGTPGYCLYRLHEAAATLNLTTTFGCNAAGDVTSTTDPRNFTTTATYDGLRRKRTETGPAGTNIQTQWDYDPHGNLTAERRWDHAASAWRSTTMTYSATNKVLTVTDASGTDTARTCYDALDRPWIAVDPSGRATRTQFNAAGQPTQVERWYTASPSDPSCALSAALPSGQSSHVWRSYHYNTGGLLSEEVDAKNNTTALVYDGIGRPLRTNYPDGSYRLDLKDQRDQTVMIRTRDGEIQQAFYDAAGRLFHTWESSPNPSGQQGRHVRLTLDHAGRPIRKDVSDQTSSTWQEGLVRDIRTYGYDGAGRVTTDAIRPNDLTMGSTTLTLTYGYDAAGNRTSITWPGTGGVATYAFDAVNRPQTVTFGGQTATLTHDSLSRRTGVSRSNGTSTTWAYETDSDLASLSHAFAGGVTGGFTYAHDAQGRITQVAASRSELEWTPPAGYARTYGAANVLNQVASEAGVALTFNANGNLETFGTTIFGWTLWGNRLASAGRPGTPGMTATYNYDSDDRRTLRTVNGTTTRTLWSGADEVGEYDASGALLRRFIPDGSGAMDARLAAVEADGTGNVGFRSSPAVCSPYSSFHVRPVTPS